MRKWMPFITDVFEALDFQSCAFRFLPYSGGFYDQDDDVWSIWCAIRDEYRAAMKEHDFLELLRKKQQDG
jgi:hypothetical protein